MQKISRVENEEVHEDYIWNGHLFSYNGVSVARQATEVNIIDICTSLSPTVIIIYNPVTTPATITTIATITTAVAVTTTTTIIVTTIANADTIITIAITTIIITVTTAPTNPAA